MKLLNYSILNYYFLGVLLRICMWLNKLKVLDLLKNISYLELE